MKVSLITVEMTDGTVHKDVRITLQDRLRLEKAAKPNNWELGNPNNSPSINSFLAWTACKREGLIDCTYEQFAATECRDLDVQNGEAVLGDPTQTEATTV